MPLRRRKLVFEEAVRVGAKQQVTIPRRISAALGLRKGDHLLVRLVDQHLEMVPSNLVPKDQLWFWTPEWQAKEREVDEALARGDYRVAASMDAFLSALKK